MIQFNLLPSVKLAYIKARRIKRLMITVSLIVGGASLLVLLLMLTTVDVVQKKHMRDLNGDISKYSSQLKSVPNLNKMLTVQNQLNTLTGLHDKKVVATRLFGYLGKFTPSQATISNLTIDYTANTIEISGSAPSLDVINSFTDGLKAATYITDAPGSAATQAFSSVVLSSFARDSGGSTYTIDMGFDPTIFDSANNITLTVPNETTPNTGTLFQKQAGE